MKNTITKYFIWTLLLWIISTAGVVYAQTTTKYVTEKACYGTDYVYVYEGQVVTIIENITQWTARTVNITIGGKQYQFVFSISVIKPKCTVEKAAINVGKGETYAWHGNTYSQPGVYMDTIGYSAQGCANIAILALEENIIGTICNGKPYLAPNGYYYYSPTKFDINYQYYSPFDYAISFNTSDHVEVINGTNSSSNTSATIHSGDSYTWFGYEYTQQGIYYDTIPNAVGCDSIGTLKLGICSQTQDTGRVRATIFKGDHFYYNGVKYTTTTHEILHLTTEWGCDSIIKLDVEVLTKQPGYLSHSMCEGDYYDWHGKHITQPGQYEDGDSVLLVSMLPRPHINAGEDIVISYGETTTLHATGADYYRWQDDPTLSSLTSANPEASPQITTTYYVNSLGSMDEVVVTNGDFSAGNTGFTTDGRCTKDCASQECCGTYMIMSSTEERGWSGPYDWQQKTNQFDHTVGDETGLYMIWDGFMVANKTLWEQTVPVQPNTSYVFSAWFASLFSSFEWGYTQFQFFVNGVQLGDMAESPHKEGVWGQYFEIWESGDNTSATLTIKNQNSGYEGNDFGLDDISFQAIGQCQGLDSVKVIINFDIHLYPSCTHIINDRPSNDVPGMPDRTVTFTIPRYCTNQYGTYVEGDQLTVYVHDEECRNFSHWSDGSTDNPRVFTVGKDDLTIQPIYVGGPFTITIKTKDGTTMQGSVTGNKQ